MSERDVTSTPDDVQELAALYAAGALTSDEREAVEARLDAGEASLVAAVAQFGGVVTEMADSVPPVEPDPSVKAALLARIGAEVAPPPSEAEVSFTVSRASEAQWMPIEIEGKTIEGAQMRILNMDAANDRVTVLLKMEPGAEFPAHVHAQTEDFFVLEGDMRWDDEVFTAGDFMHAEPGSLHPRHWTKDGCLCLVTTCIANEYV